MEELVGIVLWWDDRDRNGVIKCRDGKKYYFDVSVLNTQARRKIGSGQVVRFLRNSAQTEALCAMQVKIASSRDRYEFSSRDNETKATRLVA